MKAENQPVIIEQLPPRQLVVDRFLVRKEVLAMTRLSNTTLYKLIKNNHFPKQIRIQHSRNVVWSEFAVYQWMEQQKAGGVE